MPWVAAAVLCNAQVRQGQAKEVLKQAPFFVHTEMVQTDKERNFSASGDRNIWVHLNATFGNPLYFVPTYIPWAFCKSLPCYIYRDIV